MVAEMCFFKPWYLGLEEERKAEVKALIKEV